MGGAQFLSARCHRGGRALGCALGLGEGWRAGLVPHHRRETVAYPTLREAVGLLLGPPIVSDCAFGVPSI